jgi:hypothetical protein
MYKYLDHIELLRGATIFLCVMVLGICETCHILATVTVSLNTIRLAIRHVNALGI